MLVAVAFTSCYKDEGNYDYHLLDEVRIDTTGTGIQSQYAIMRYDTLHLEPRIFFNGQLVKDETNAPLDFLWTIYSAHTGAGANTRIDTLSTHAILNEPIPCIGGNYQLRLSVTNRNDGTRTFFPLSVSVSEVFDGGWLVLYERADHPDNSDVALIYNPWTKRNANYDRRYVNLYEGTNGELLPGKPVRVLDIAVSLVSGNNYIGLCTDRTLVGVSENGIEKALSFADFFYEAPATEAPVWYGQHGSGVMSGQSSEILINDNHVYTNTYSFSASEGRNTRFGVHKFADGIGKLAPWNAEVPNTLSYGVVVYDQTYHRFRFAGYNQAQLEEFGPQNLAVAAFDINNTGMELLMGDWGRGVSEGMGLRPYDYLLMANGARRYLAVTDFATTNSSSENIGIGLYPLDALCPDINQATTMAASHVGSFIYYGAGNGAGNKVYSLAYDSQLPATVAWTAPSADEQVTCVRIMKYYHGSIYASGLVPYSDNLVHIATWNEQTREGHLYEYLINPASGILDTDKHYEYTIPGKVKDMAWKFSMQ